MLKFLHICRFRATHYKSVDMVHFSLTANIAFFKKTGVANKYLFCVDKMLGALSKFEPKCGGGAYAKRGAFAGEYGN